MCSPAPVQTIHDHAHTKSDPEPPDLRPPSNSDLPVAWITDPDMEPIHSLFTLYIHCAMSGL
jgi:hypothetical protein